MSLSMRKSGVMKNGGIFSADFLKVLIPSLLLSHILALGLGYATSHQLSSSQVYTCAGVGVRKSC